MHTKKEYRQFGLILAGVVGGVFGLLLPWWHHAPLPSEPFRIAAPLIILALLRPQFLKPFYSIWMRLGAILGWINTRIILTVIFYVVICPIGLLKKIFSKDAMARSYNKQSATYRVISEPQKPDTMEKPY